MPGAQVATRTVFMPELWPIRVSALDPAGRPKTGAKVAQDVAGPCCFAGDIVASRRHLPLLEPDDWVLLHDTGAYYFSTPFVYNSLPRVAVHGFRAEAGQVRFELMRREESLGELLAGTSLAAGAQLLRAPRRSRGWSSASASCGCGPGRPPPARLCDALEHLRGRCRWRDQVALHMVAAVTAQEVELGIGLDAFGHDFQPQAVPEIDDRADDGRVVSIIEHVADEATGRS